MPTIRVQGRTTPPGIVNPPGSQTSPSLVPPGATQAPGGAGDSLTQASLAASTSGPVNAALQMNAMRNAWVTAINVSGGGGQGGVAGNSGFVPPGVVSAGANYGNAAAIGFLRNISQQTQTTATINQQQWSAQQRAFGGTGFPQMPGVWPGAPGAGGGGAGGGGFGGWGNPPPGFGGWGGMGGAGGGPRGPGFTPPWVPLTAGGGGFGGFGGSGAPPPLGGGPPGGGGGFGGGRNPLGTLGGMVGLGTTGRLLGSAVGLGGPAGVGIALGLEAAKEILTLPQTIAGMEGNWLSRTAQARSYRTGLYAMGQGGGFRGDDLRERLSGANGVADFLQRSGLGPDEAMNMVRGTGVAQQSADQGYLTAQALSLSRISPGISSVPIDMQMGIIRNTLGLGAGERGLNPDRARDVVGVNGSIQAIMLQTAQTGQDQLRVLQSIDQGVGTLSLSPNAATAITPMQLFSANQQMLSTPAGRAGVAGTRSIEETQTAWSTVGTNAPRTIIASQLSRQLQTEGDFARFFGRSNGGTEAWNRFKSSPAGQVQLEAYMTSVKKGDTMGAVLALSGILQDPGLSEASTDALTNNPISNQFSGGLKLASQAALSNRSQAEIAARIAARRPGEAAGEAANNPLNLMYSGQPNAAAYRLDNNRVLAAFPDLQSGISASIQQLQRYEKNGLKTVSQLVHTWAPDAPDSYVNDVARGLGVGPNSLVNMNDPVMAEKYIRAAQPHETGNMRMSDAAIRGGVTMAFGQPSPNPNLRDPNTEDPNAPGYNPATSTAKSNQIMGSNVTLNEGAPIITGAQPVVEGVWKGVIFAADALSAAIKTAAQAMSGGSPSSAAGSGGGPR